MTAPLEAVLLLTPRPVDAVAAGRAVAAALGIPAPDAVRQARYCGGLLLEAVAADVAGAAVAALEGAGVAARRVASATLPVLSASRRALRIDTGDDALGLEVDPALGAEQVGWDRVALILAHGLDETTDRSRQRLARNAPADLKFADRDPETLLAGEETGLSPAAVRLIAGLARRRHTEGRRTRLRVDIVLGDGRVIRVRREDVDRFRAPGLALAAPHSIEAFVVVARAIAARATRAVRPPENEALIESGLLEPALFAYEEELTRYERWLLATAAAPAP
jgi:hypothetical protein